MPCQHTNHAELRRLTNFLQPAGFLCALLLPTVVLAAALSTGRVFTPVAANNDLPVLTKVAQVRELSPQEASRGYPVRVIGVLTYCDPPSYKQFVQDDSEGIYVDFNGNQTSDVLRPGQQVEILGFSGPGDYAPVIHAKQTRVLGADKFPTAKPTTIQILMTGAEDSQWVVLRGIIRDQAVATNETVLVLATGEATMQLKLPSAAGTPTPTNLVDAAVGSAALFLTSAGACEESSCKCLVGSRSRLGSPRRQIRSSSLHALSAICLSFIPAIADCTGLESGAPSSCAWPMAPFSCRTGVAAFKCRRHRLRPARESAGHWRWWDSRS